MSFENILNFLQEKKEFFEEDDLKSVIEIIKNAESKEQKKHEERKSNPDKLLAEEYKEKGNIYFKGGDYQEAVKNYSLAIEEDPLNEIYYSNRAAGYGKIGETELGIKDCLKAVELNPSFAKGYLRLGAFYYESDVSKAIQYYDKVLEIEPENEVAKLKLDVLKGKSQNKQNESFDPTSTDKIGDLMNNPEIRGMVKDILKNKSPEEIADLMKNFMKK